MSEIPYYFETPVPKYFRENGWYSNPNTILFLTWAFSKCSLDARTVVHDAKIIKLQPFEFITGRGKSSADCLLTEDAFKHQLNTLLKAGFLKKSANSVPNRYTCYIWVTEAFSKGNTQLNTQLNANSTPTQRPQSRKKKERDKEDHQPYPSSNDSPNGVDDGKGMTDDFSLNLKKDEEMIEVIPGILLSKEDLNACISIKGSLDAVKHAIEYIMRSPSRKRKIYNWPNTLTKWEIKDDIKPRLKENEEMGKRLDAEYSNSVGWRCEFHIDRKKDQKGVLFYNTASTGNSEPIFISFIDPEFKEKASKVIREKRMQKGRISNS